MLSALKIAGRLSVLLALAGCAQSSSGTIPSARAHELVASGATLLDVRTPEEYSARHVEGALNVPIDDLAERSKDVPAGKPVVVYCASGMRSAAAVKMLKAAGRTDVYDLGPMRNW